mmetsp:Transcript_53451/g.106321  ORF Transcript_53451/g.106321 Transcript_53451/m.106321 type:complete len:89 (+) Transcript_53451:2357-2623(+)
MDATLLLGVDATGKSSVIGANLCPQASAQNGACCKRPRLDDCSSHCHVPLPLLAAYYLADVLPGQVLPLAMLVRERKNWIGSAACPSP